MAVVIPALLLLAAASQLSATAPPPAAVFCAVTHYPNPSISLWCDGSAMLSQVAFADWGLPATAPNGSAAGCGHFAANATCTSAAAATKLVRQLCLGRRNCTIPNGDELNKAVGGDPCSGVAKTLRVEAACSAGNGHSGVPPPPPPPPRPPPPPAPTGPSYAAELRQLKVEYVRESLAIDILKPTFSWELQHPDRAVVQRAFSLVVWKRGREAETMGRQRSEASNSSIFVSLPHGLTLESDTSYEWRVEVEVFSVAGTHNLTASSTFSTGLMASSDWDARSAWLVASSKAPMPPGCAACFPTAQLRKDFTLPTGTITRARLFVSIPGTGRVSLNGVAVDGIVGTRSRSQYEIRTLYSTFDVAAVLRVGSNTLGISIGGGWYSLYGFGPPTMRCLLRATIAGAVYELGSDGTWHENPGPVGYASIYEGVSHDARLETPGWDTTGYKPAAGVHWTPAVLGNTSSSWKLGHARLASATVPAVRVTHTLTSNRIQEPAPGLYIFDFGQAITGFVRLHITGERGAVVQLRHGDVLTYPSLGGHDFAIDQPMGTVYLQDLDSANQTDLYTLRGTEGGEMFEPWGTTHGFRYVQLRYLTGGVAPPSLDTLEALAIRSGVEQSGRVSFGERHSVRGRSLLNVLQDNVLWGQADNLQGVPQDCNQRSERQGWTGDAALTADESSLNFDMGGLYQNWLEILVETSPHGAIACTVPGASIGGGIGANQSCDASWATVLPTTAHALMKYEGDTTVGSRYWEGITRYADNTIARASYNSGCNDGAFREYKSKCGILNMFVEFGDWIGEPGIDGWPNGRKDGSASGLMLAAYSFIKDLGFVAEMARWLGKRTDVAKYSAARMEMQRQFHTVFYNATQRCYGCAQLYGCHGSACACGQASNSVGLLAMEGSPLFTPAIQTDTADFLVRSLLNFSNHTTCGIISWKAQLEALGHIGAHDMAFAVFSQKAYPGLGWEALNKDEPATSIWEQWGAPVLSGGMDSRNHPMFAGPADAMYSQFGGLTQAPGSFGFAHPVFRPPAKIIGMAAANVTLNPNISQPLWLASVSKRTLRGTFEMRWALPPDPPQAVTTCAVHGYPKSGGLMYLECPNPQFNKIAGVSYALFGSPPANSSSTSHVSAVANTDHCPLATGLYRQENSSQFGCGFDLSAIIAKACVGQSRCHVHCSEPGDNYKNCRVNGLFVNTSQPPRTPPCAGSGVLGVQIKCPSPLRRGTILTIEVVVPANSLASTHIPLLDATPHAMVITEGGKALWRNGAYVAGAVAGVTGATLENDVVVIEHGSGRYDFSRSDA